MSYFGTTKRGEIPELQEELNSLKPERKKEAVKKVIAAMTVGKDVSPLFPHVVKCMETTNLELKKLVYLYIINYAKTQPDAAILAVNTFRKDAVQRVNPLIRALAVRTMGCLRVSQIAEYLCDPLRAALQDDDPYVRKTAAICVSKLYDITPELVEDNGFLDILINLLSDGNSMVVANAVAALCEIAEMKRQPISFITLPICSKLLTALNECTEWGQVFILDCLAQFTPPDSNESERILERVTPRLSHANPAVVLSAVRVCMKYMDFITSAETIRTLCRKLTPPLVTLLSSEPEIQFISLRNINLIIQKRPNILERDIKVFFCKYNDPIYVKLEKLEIMIKLSDLKNVDQVLHEFKEYATEIDVEFVRKSVRAIGRCAIKLERAAERCIQCLLDLIQLRVNYVVQEAIVVIRDIFRKYPNRYEMIIKDLFDNLESLDEPEAKASMIWIIGEYSERIEDATSQLTTFIDGFKDEPTHVQLQILTSTVKLFLKKPEESEDLITRVLKLSTEESDNPDLRDRGFIYWRLLSTDPEAAKLIVLSEKPTISEESYTLEQSLLDRLLEGLGTLSSVYHKPPETFLTRDPSRSTQPVEEPLESQDIQGQDYGEQIKEAEVIDSTGQNRAQIEQSEFYGIGQVDLLGIEESETKQAAQVQKQSEKEQLEQMFMTTPSLPQGKTAKIPLQTVLQPTQAGQNGKIGVQIEAAFQKGPLFEIRIINQSQETLQNFQIQFNVNAFCLAINPQLPFEPIFPGQQSSKQVQVTFSGNSDNNPPATPFLIQMAIRCSLDTFYFQTPCMFSVLLAETAPNIEEFTSKWSQIQNEIVHQIKIHADFQNPESRKARLASNAVYFVMENQGVQYYCVQSINKYKVFAELQPTGQIKVKSEQRPLVPLFAQSLNFLLGTNY